MDPHEVMIDCPSFITSPPCPSHLVDPSENILPKNTEYDEEGGMVSP